MKKRLHVLAASLAFVFLFAGCEKSGTPSTSSASSKEDATTHSSISKIMADTSTMFSDRDYEIGYDESTAVSITLDGDTADSSSDAVKISGSVVTISYEGTYIISGTLDDGMLVVDAESTDKVHLVLGGVSINSQTSAAIYIAQADKVFVTLAPDSVNTLSNGGTFTPIDDNNIDAAFFKGRSDTERTGRADG